MASSTAKPQFTLYGHVMGPNPQKVEMVMRELGLDYEDRAMDLGHNGPPDGPNGIKSENFLKINPNGRIPALVDHSNNDFAVWESDAILLYLVRKYDPEFTLWAKTLEDQSMIEQWLFFQASGQGPYMGQAMWFHKYHSEKLPSAVERYFNETRRILGVVERQLTQPGSNGWLVLGRITIADLSFIPWFRNALPVFGIETEKDFPAVHSWMAKMCERPGVKEITDKVAAFLQKMSSK